MQYVYDWIKNIVVYLILVNVIMNLLGKSNFKKYIGIFTGLLLVVLVITPIMKLCKWDGTFDYYFDANNFVVEAEDLSTKMSDMEKGQKERIIKEYKMKIKEQVKQLVKAQDMYLVDVKIEMIEDENNASYGTINQMDITLSYYEENEHKKEDKSDILEIEKIQIEDVKIKSKGENKKENGKKEKGKKEILSLPEIQIKNSIADFYNISVDNININIQE